MTCMNIIRHNDKKDLVVFHGIAIWNFSNLSFFFVDNSDKLHSFRPDNLGIPHIIDWIPNFLRYVDINIPN